MKKIILSAVATTLIATSSFAFTDNYSINENMAERYKSELKECFSFLQEEPSSKKYFNSEFSYSNNSSYVGKLSDINYNDRIRNILLEGGYGAVKGQDSVKLFQDVEDLFFAGSIIASALKNGRESIFVKPEDVDKFKRIGNKKNYSVMNVGGLCNKKVILDRDMAKKLVSLYKEFNDKYWYFNGDLESYTSQSFKYSVKGNVELYGGGIPLYTKDSYFGYSLNRANSLTRK